MEALRYYRWFIVVFILLFFVLIPGIVVGLTLLPDYVIIIFIFVVLIVIITAMQKHFPGALPSFLRSWDWVPIYLRSLEPYDPMMTAFFTAIPFVGGFFKRSKVINHIDNGDSVYTMIKLSKHTQV
ncbi:hypothetical protein COOONC_14218 [Cooperia oncophora]